MTTKYLDHTECRILRVMKYLADNNVKHFYILDVYTKLPFCENTINKAMKKFHKYGFVAKAREYHADFILTDTGLAYYNMIDEGTPEETEGVPNHITHVTKYK